MLETEFDKSKEDKNSKVKEFMKSTWKGFERQAA
jgi:2-oxoglutarate dehydrogenase E1 component